MSALFQLPRALSPDFNLETLNMKVLGKHSGRCQSHVGEMVASVQGIVVFGPLVTGLPGDLESFGV